MIADVFGSQIVVGGSFDPLLRNNGLTAVGATAAVITKSGFQQYDSMARSIAAQVLASSNRATVLPCSPVTTDGADDRCAGQFIVPVGRKLFRRALGTDEVAAWTRAASSAADTAHDFYTGLAAALAGMLVSPDFLFIDDSTEPDGHGGQRLTGYAKASRLSFLLWDSGPDELLLAAAERGELDEQRGIERQVDRMLASPRLKRGVRAFFSDMLRLDGIDRLEKDSIIYPAFTVEVARDAREQLLRTITAQLIDDEGDYRDLFTTRKTFMTGALARIYRVGVERPDGAWMRYEFGADDPRGGILTQIGFAALFSHPGRSSPTLRGRAIREALLCQKVPDPPGDVDFSLFNDPNSPNKTARQRLSAHATAPTCAGCHKLTDPVGLGMEKIDGAGQVRTTENGVAIDTTGNLDGIPFADARGLGRAMHDNPAISSCVVNRLASYAMGRAPGNGDRALLDYFLKSFAADDYRFTSLLRRIATSRAFFEIGSTTARTAGAQTSREKS